MGWRKYPNTKLTEGFINTRWGAGSLQSSKWLREANTIVTPYESTFLFIFIFKLKETE